jgi:hypothetical protein
LNQSVTGIHRKSTKERIMQSPVFSHEPDDHDATSRALVGPTLPEATRTVWAVATRRPTTAPDYPDAPYHVVWIGDPTLRTAEGVCAYCANQGITQDCPGVGEHAWTYAKRFSQRTNAIAVAVEPFDIDVALPRPDIAAAIEATIAARSGAMLGARADGADTQQHRSVHLGLTGIDPSKSSHA